MEVPFTRPQSPRFFRLNIHPTVLRFIVTRECLVQAGGDQGHRRRLVRENNYWYLFTRSVVSCQVTLSPHRVRVLHNDIISLALARRKETYHPHPFYMTNRTAIGLVVPRWQSPYSAGVRRNPRLPATTGYRCLPTIP